jgi:peroxiredoxin
MATISSNIGDISTYGNRMVTIAFTGMNQQSVHLAHQQTSISYNRLSQTLQNIQRNGGKVIAVSMDGAIAPAASKNKAPDQQPENSPSSNKKKR